MTHKLPRQYRLLHHADDCVVVPEKCAGLWELWVIAGILLAACLSGTFALLR